MKHIYATLIFLTLSSYIVMGQTAAISVGLTSATNFIVTFTPAADIVAGTSAVPYGIVIAIPKSVYPVQPSIAGFAFTPNPTYGSSTNIQTFDDAINGFWVYRFINSPALTIPGPTTYTGGTAYTLASFTVPTGVNVSDISFRDYASNIVPSYGPDTGGTVLTIGGVSRINNNAVFAQNPDSTNPPMNCNGPACTSSLQFNAAPLPIELLSFEPRTSKCDLSLYWETATEKNFGYFEIEASKDGSHFVPIAQQKPASPNSLEKRTYKYAVPQSYHGYYFRLKSVDLDEKYDYSKIVYTQAPCDKQYSAQLYPNPNVIENVTVEISSAENEDQVQLIVLDAVGKHLQTQQVDIQAGVNKITVDTQALPSGTYFIKIVGITKLSAPLKFIKSTF